MKKILNVTLVDDDRNYLQILSFALDDLNLRAFSDPNDALRSIKSSPPDAVILDLHMEDTDGFELCQEIRKFNLKVPILFLTSDCSIPSMTKGLNLGCIEYLNKSLTLDELKLRIVHRIKSIQSASSSTHFLEVGWLQMDLNSHIVLNHGQPIQFSPKEYKIMKVFMENPNKLMTKTDLLELLWKGVSVSANNIDTQIFHIRKKLGPGKTQIHTLKAQGYILKTDGSEIVE